MKMFFINTPDTDYLQDLTYSGLSKILGVERVIDYPIHWSYHLPTKVYPKNIGYKKSNLFKRAFASIKEYDAVIVGSCSPKCFINYLEILPSIPSYVPIIFLDGGDWPDVGGDMKRLKASSLWEEAIKIRPFDLIFKREFFENGNYPDKIKSFPFCMNMDKISQISKKKYDVSFWAVESDPIRTKALKLLEDKFDCKANGTTRNQKFHKYKRKGKFYLEELSACKIVLNFRGAGWDTMRYWETPAMNTFMISQKPGIMIPNDFKNGKHIVHCKDDLSDLIELCEYYLEHEDEREKIATASYNHLLKYHTDVVRAQYLLDQVNLLRDIKGH